MEAMCEWCGQVVPIGLDGSCFLGHPVSASAVATAAATPWQDDAPGQPEFDLDIAAAPPEPLDTVPPMPDFAAMPPPMVAPPVPVDQGPVPAVLAPQGPVFAPTPAGAAPQPPQVPLMPPAPPPMPMPLAPVPVTAAPVPGAVGAAAAPLPMAANPVDAAFAPLISADVPAQVPPPPGPFPAPPSGPALPPQAPTGPGWQAVHIADDVAVFEYRPPRAAVPGDEVVATLPPPLTQAPHVGVPTEQTPVVPPGLGPLPPAATGGPPPGDPYHSVVSEEDVAAFAPGDELDIPRSGSRTRQIVLLAILVVVALAAAIAFAFGLI